MFGGGELQLKVLVAVIDYLVRYGFPMRSLKASVEALLYFVTSQSFNLLLPPSLAVYCSLLRLLPKHIIQSQLQDIIIRHSFYILPSISQSLLHIPPLPILPSVLKHSQSICNQV